MLCTLSFGPLRDTKLFNSTVFDMFDMFSSDVVLPVGGILVCIFVGWRMSVSDLYSELASGNANKMRLFNVFRIIVKYIAPVAILIIMLSSFGLF